jgi:hypothetical protein
MLPGVDEDDLVRKIERCHPEGGGRTHRAAAPDYADS